MNGFEACRLVRQKFDFLSCPVVHGPQDSDQLRLAAFRAGANIFMFAPIKFDKHYVLSLLVNGRRRYKRSPAEEFLRIVDREYCAGKEIEDCVIPVVSAKSVILRWTNILTEVVFLKNSN